jgi:hypothetical protein
LHAYVTRRGADWSLDQVSRFLDAEVRGLMQRIALGDDDRPAQPEPMPAITVDLRALLRGRFGA